MTHVYLVNEKRFFQNKHQYATHHETYAKFADAVNRLIELKWKELEIGSGNYSKDFVDNSVEYARVDVMNDTGKHIELEVEKVKVL